jgi:hypothetical protein
MIATAARECQTQGGTGEIGLLDRSGKALSREASRDGVLKGLGAYHAGSPTGERQAIKGVRLLGLSSGALTPVRCARRAQLLHGCPAAQLAMAVAASGPGSALRSSRRPLPALGAESGAPLGCRRTPCSLYCAAETLLLDLLGWTC